MSQDLKLIRSFNPDGTVTLAGGKTMQAVVNSAGSMGLIEHKPEHVTEHLDQVGVDQSKPPDDFFDVSGLDQG